MMDSLEPIPSETKPNRVWSVIWGWAVGLCTELSRLYRTLALFGFPLIALFFVSETMRVMHQTKQPPQYEFVASTVIKASCSPANNCTTRTDFRKTYRSADECMNAIRSWFSFRTQSTVDVVIDASCRIVGLGEPLLGPVAK